MPAPNIISFGTVSLDVDIGKVGTLVTVSNTGTGFFGTMVVTVGAVTGTEITVVDHQHLTFLSPAESGDIVITNPDEETVTFADAWTNVAAPIISTVNPATGGAGDSIVLTGSFPDYAASTVTIGGQAATVTASSAVEITVTAPAHADGLVDVIVTDSYEQSYNKEGSFTYATETLAIISVSLNTGTLVMTITGTLFGSSQGLGGVEFRIAGSTEEGDWIGPASYDGWADGLISCTLTALPADGTYNVKVTTNDLDTVTKLNAFRVGFAAPANISLRLEKSFWMGL